MAPNPRTASDSRPTPRPFTAPRSLGAAFSMAELVIVLVIIAIVSVIAVPRMAGVAARYRADSAARRIATDLAMAAGQARLVSASRTLVFDLARSRYSIAGVRSLTNAASTTYLVDLQDDPYHATLISADFGGDSTLIFNGFGVPDSGGTLVLRVGTEQRTLTLDPASARVTTSH